MKPRIITAILLFISAFSPLFVILVIKDFDFLNKKFSHPIFSIITLGVVLLSIVLTLLIIKMFEKGDMVINIIKVGNRSSDIINYTIPYMLSLIGIKLDSPSDVISISIFLIVLMILTITSKSVFINPILSVVGYGLYDIDYEYSGKIYSIAAFCKKQICINEDYYLKSLTQFIGIIKEEYNENT